MGFLSDLHEFLKSYPGGGLTLGSSQTMSKGITGNDKANITHKPLDRPFLLAIIPVGMTVASVSTVIPTVNGNSMSNMAGSTPN
jgi:hypothetical protein